MISLNFSGVVNMHQEPPQFIEPQLLDTVRDAVPADRKPNSTQAALSAIADILEPLVKEHNNAVYDRFDRMA